MSLIGRSAHLLLNAEAALIDCQSAIAPAFANAQRQRKKVEALFAELKNQIGLRRLRLRRLKFFASSSSWQRLRKISNGSFASSAKDQGHRSQ